MSTNHEICLRAEHSPYWTRIYETCDGIFLEDIFSVKKKQDPLSFPSWEDAIMKAMDNLAHWKNKIDGFDDCIEIRKEMWPDYHISFSKLSTRHNPESDYLLKMLCGKKYFDTGWAVMSENGFSLRILCVCNRLQIQVRTEIADLTEFVKKTLYLEEEVWMPNRTIEDACQELKDRPDFSCILTAEAILSKDSAYIDITDRISLLIMEICGKLEEQQRLARAAVLDLDQGTPVQYAVVVDIPNTSQRGYFISARNTRELMTKLLNRADIGSSATITYSLVLSDHDIMLE